MFVRINRTLQSFDCAIHVGQLEWRGGCVVVGVQERTRLLNCVAPAPNQNFRDQRVNIECGGKIRRGHLLSERQQRLPLLYCLAGLHFDGADGAIARGLEFVFHFHGFQHDDDLALLH